VIKGILFADYKHCQPDGTYQGKKDLLDFNASRSRQWEIGGSTIHQVPLIDNLALLVGHSRGIVVISGESSDEIFDLLSVNRCKDGERKVILDCSYPLILIVSLIQTRILTQMHPRALVL